MSEIVYPYDPNKTQTKFHASNKQFKGLKGAKGAGKTRPLSVEMTALMYEFPGNNGVIARKDYPALERTTMSLFLQWLPKNMLEHYDKQKRKLIIKSKDWSDNSIAASDRKPSTLWFVQEKEPKEYDSMELGCFAIDEADECPWETAKTIMSRLRIKHIPNYGLFAFNPPNKRHWLYDFFVTQPTLDPSITDRELFHTNTYENEKNLKEGYIDELKRLYTGDELNRYLYGEWGSSSNEWQVFPEWRSSIHVSKEELKPIPGLPILRAWDFGMRAGCLCAQLFDGQLRVLHEVMEFNKGAKQFIPIALSRQLEIFKDFSFLDFSDPTFVKNRSSADSTMSCRKELREAGIFIKGGTIEWEKRTRAVTNFMTRTREGEPCLIVNPSCNILIAGFEGGYRFKEGAHERQAQDVVKDEYSELQDCLQHIACYAQKEYLNKDTYSLDIPKEVYAFR